MSTLFFKAKDREVLREYRNQINVIENVIQSVSVHFRGRVGTFGKELATAKSYATAFVVTCQVGMPPRVLSTK